jgi:F0F1-type ATP synthase epsilon subunit
MNPTMTVEILSPGWVQSFANVVRTRLEAFDGSRGVLAGHEPSRAQLLPGPVELTFDDGTQAFVATEGGLAWLDRDSIRIATPWACAGADLEELAESVRSRARLRSEAEAQARALAQRHEKAAQRALVALRRGGPS